MNLGIIIPLKSYRVSSNWQSVCNSLKNTLNSVIAQTNSNYTVMIVGHEKPEFLDDNIYNNINFHSITEIEPPVKKEHETEISQEQYTFDKNMKIAKGIQILFRSAPDITHWFVLDADDLMNKNFIDLCEKMNIGLGAIINRGFIYYTSSNRIIECNELSLYCGSTGVISKDSFTVPEKINEHTMRYIPFCRYSHMNLNTFFINELKVTYKNIPDYLIVYVLANGENISDGFRNNWIAKLKQKIKPYIKGKKVSKELKSIFSIQ